MDPGVLTALEVARRFDWSLPATAAAIAAARDIAIALGAKHPEAGTCKAIQAVLDQLENPSSFTGNPAAYEKHGAGRGTFMKWKKKLTPILGSVVVDDEDDDLAAALDRSAARLAAPQDGQAVNAPPQFLARAAPEPAVSGDVLADAAEASGVSLAEALDKLILSAADQHAAAIGAVEEAEAEAALRETDAADAARDAADAVRDAAEAAQAAEAATVRARQAAALADSARARVAAAHLAVEAAAVEAAGEAAVRDEAREAEQRQRAEAAAPAAGSSASDAPPPPASADGASSSAAGQTLAAGQRVSIRGVQTRTELNGTYGRVIAFDAERGRIAVELEGSHKHVQTGRVQALATQAGRPQRSVVYSLMTALPNPITSLCVACAKE